MILEQIAADTRLRLIEEKKLVSPEEMKEKALALAADETFPFEKMLKEPGIHYICEVKKASPSKGLIAEDFPYLQIAKEYEAAGADAISCLTEPKYFLGKKEYLKAITDEVSIPVLRKDFTVDEYQIYEAKTLGAGVVLLICALLPTEKLKEYLAICEKLGLTALVETHDEAEIASAVEAGARVIGVNNRNLKNFTVDERDMCKYIIGTISGKDVPKTPQMKGSVSKTAYFCGVTEEMLQKERNQILNASVEDIRALADIVKAVLDAEQICVVGSESKVEGASDILMEVKSLINC